MVASSAGSVGAGLLILLLIGLGICLYFLPTVIALVRHTANPGMTIVLNVFLGWTFIGWVIALVMAFGPVSPEYGNRR